MLTASEEVYIWEDLLQGVRKLLVKVDSGRTDVKERWDDATPEFNQMEDMLDAVRGMIECRIRELDPTRNDQADRAQVQWQARKALSHGVNFKAFSVLPYDETDAALRYLEEHGLVSMDYEMTLGGDSSSSARAHGRD